MISECLVHPVASIGKNNYGCLEAMDRGRDEKFMRAALNEAKKGLGQTSPNPAVGAVLVVGNRIVARGHHRRAGRDHAEVECLRNFPGAVPARATLYVTLEPCSTEGRTAPCADAILQAGVRNVVVGAIDVNPRHSGKGIVKLRNAGVTVRNGVPTARQPPRVVFSPSGNLPQHAHLFSDRHASRTLIYRRKSLAAVLKNLGERGVTSVLIEGGGEVFSQALDARVIDKVHLYL